MSILAEFAGGVSVNLEVSTHAAARGPSIVTFVGSDGALRLDLRGRTSSARTRPAPGSRVEIDPADVEEWQVEAEFVGAVRGEREVRRNPFSVGLEYMTYSDAVVESAATGRRLTLEREEQG